MRFGVPLFRPHVLQPPGDPLHVLAAGDVFDVRKKKSVSTQTKTSLAVVLLYVLVITVCGEAIFQYVKVIFTESMIQLNTFAFAVGKCSFRFGNVRSVLKNEFILQ